MNSWSRLYDFNGTQYKYKLREDKTSIHFYRATPYAYATFTWSFTWCGHTSRNLCSQRVNQTSVHEKKPIRVFLNRCRWFLKQLTESTSNACWSRLFHLLISLSVKKLRLTSNVLLCLTSFSVCPLRCFIVDNSNIDSRGIADQPLAILNTSMIGSIPSFFQTPQSQLFQPLVWVWHCLYRPTSVGVYAVGPYITHLPSRETRHFNFGTINVNKWSK